MHHMRSLLDQIVNFIYLFIKSCELLYHFHYSINITTNHFLTTKELNYFDHQILNAITQLKKWMKPADIDATYTQTLKMVISEMLAGIFRRIKTLLEVKIKHKISNTLDS